MRFISPTGTCQIRVQILSAAGDSVFDSAWKDGNVLDWAMASPGQPLTSGSYRCLVMVRDLDGRVSEKEATLIAQDGQVSIEERPGAEGVKSPKVTLLAHDGENGAVVSTGGDLTFRFGNYLAGTDSERMRLTAEGHLGIGTDKPQAPLDVNGLIRTSGGIMFSDGTILTTAAGLPGVAEGGGTVSRRPTAPMIGPVGILPGSRPAVMARPLNPVPTVGLQDYQFKVDTLGVHIGTTSAFGLDVGGNVNLSSNLLLPRTTASGLAGVITLNGHRFVHAFGVSNTFVGESAGNFYTTGILNVGIGLNVLATTTPALKTRLSALMRSGPTLPEGTIRP